MEKNEKYTWVPTVLGDLQFHNDIYEDLVGQYPEEEQEAMLLFFLAGCKNFFRHPQDVLNELERDLK